MLEAPNALARIVPRQILAHANRRHRLCPESFRSHQVARITQVTKNKCHNYRCPHHHCQERRFDAVTITWATPPGHNHYGCADHCFCAVSWNAIYACHESNCKAMAPVERTTTYTALVNKPGGAARYIESQTYVCAQDYTSQCQRCCCTHPETRTGANAMSIGHP